jgi:hypothetical protein
MTSCRPAPSTASDLGHPLAETDTHGRKGAKQPITPTSLPATSRPPRGPRPAPSCGPEPIADSTRRSTPSPGCAPPTGSATPPSTSTPWPASSPRPNSSCPRPSTTPATRNSPGPRWANSSAPPPPPRPAATAITHDQLDKDHVHNAEMSTRALLRGQPEQGAASHGMPSPRIRALRCRCRAGRGRRAPPPAG